ncbi:hypothetical protein UlMin_016009, partial [Ulmus minor]
SPLRIRFFRITLRVSQTFKSRVIWFFLLTSLNVFQHIKIVKSIMATRAILRRKRFITDYINTSFGSIQSFQYIGHGNAYRDSGSRAFHPSAAYRFTSDSNINDADKSSVRKEELGGLLGVGQFRTGYYGTTISALRNGRSELMSPVGIKWVSQSLRNASTATAAAAAKKHDMGSDDEENGELVSNKRKEASPEDCDQAVEGLSTAKAKARAKKLQAQKVANTVLRRVWATFLGIGPALKAVASMSREDWAKKLIYWKGEVVSTLQHYWLGFKLLWADVRICSRLLLKLADGKNLSRREKQQLTRTTADIFRLVPFAVFIIVPFMEFLLPVFLKLFPNMLPSTFQDKMKEQEALKRRLIARIEYAKFLQDTAKEMAKEVQNSRSGENKKTAKDLDVFLNNVRKGAGVANEEILAFAKLFNDELTLDNISRPRLVNMCKYMGISPFGTDAYLRYMLRKRLQRIKEDDKLIQAEGVESLSEAELREDCRERGMLGLLSVEEMRQELRDWLDLSLNHSVPSSLLILSRAFTVSGRLKPEEAVQATLSSLPDEVVETVGVTALPSEDSVSERRRKLEYLEMQEELIKSVSREREEFLRLVNKEIELYNSMVEKEGMDGEKDAMTAYRAAHVETENADEEAGGDEVSSALIDRVDAMLQNLEKEIDDVDAKIGDRWQILDRDFDGKVTPEEVAVAAMYLKNTLGKEGIQELISSLSKDREGKILVEDIVRLGSRTEEYAIEADQISVDALSELSKMVPERNLRAR